MRGWGSRPDVLGLVIRPRSEGFPPVYEGVLVSLPLLRGYNVDYGTGSERTVKQVKK